MGSTLIFQVLYINVLNYRYFHTNCSTFLKVMNVGKIKKLRLYRKIKKNVYKRLLQLCYIRLIATECNQGETMNRCLLII